MLLIWSNAIFSIIKNAPIHAIWVHCINLWYASHGGYRQGEGRLRVRQAEPRRRELLPTAETEPVGETGGALDADG